MRVFMLFHDKGARIAKECSGEDCTCEKPHPGTVAYFLSRDGSPLERTGENEFLEISTGTRYFTYAPDTAGPN
jgi:hypothetical protein